MTDRRTVLTLMVAGALCAVSAAPAWAADLKSPDQVKTALRLMMQVTNDFDRQITRKTYPRLPHENMEFQEAAAALRAAVASEPAAFRTKVDAAVTSATREAQKVADDSAAGQEAELRAGHGRLLNAVNAVFAYFPEDLRPDPNVQPGRPPARQG